MLWAILAKIKLAKFSLETGEKRLDVGYPVPPKEPSKSGNSVEIIEKFYVVFTSPLNCRNNVPVPYL